MYLHKVTVRFTGIGLRRVACPKMRPVFCGNLDYDARQSEIERLFSKYGRVERVDMKSGKAVALNCFFLNLSCTVFKFVYPYCTYLVFRIKRIRLVKPATEAFKRVSWQVAADEFHTKMKISILTFPILFAKLLIQVDSYDNSCGIVLLQTLMGSNGVQIKNWYVFSSFFSLFDY